MTTNEPPMFFDITLVYNESVLYNLTKLEDIQRFGVSVPIDPKDQAAVIAYFRNPTSGPQPGNGRHLIETIDRRVEYERRQLTDQPKLLYLVRGRDDGVYIRPSIRPELDLLESGCCIALLDAGQSAPAISMSQINALQAGLLDAMCNRTRWEDCLDPLELGRNFFEQFEQFSLDSDSRSDFVWPPTVNEGRMKTEAMASLIREINGPLDALPSMKKPFQGRAVSTDSKDRLVIKTPVAGAVHGFPDGKVEYWKRCIMIVELKKQAFNSKDVEQALSQCLALAEKPTPMFCLMTDLQTNWMIIWNSIVREGGLRYDEAIKNTIGQHKLEFPTREDALPVIRGLLLYCRSYFVRHGYNETDWWEKRDHPGDAGPTEEDRDYTDGQRERRRSAFFRVFDIACGISNVWARTQSSHNDHGLMQDPYSGVQNTIEYHQDPGKPPIVALKRAYDQHLLDNDIKPVRYEDLDEQEKEIWHRLKKDFIGMSYQDALLHVLKEAQDEEGEAEERAREAASLAAERVRLMGA